MEHGVISKLHAPCPMLLAAFDPVAQSAERLALTQEAGGANPSGVAIFTPK